MWDNYLQWIAQSCIYNPFFRTIILLSIFATNSVQKCIYISESIVESNIKRHWTRLKDDERNLFWVIKNSFWNTYLDIFIGFSGFTF